MIELNQNNIDIDAITVSEILRQKNQMENIGGEVTLIELLDKVPTAANVEYYTQIVLEKSTRRKLIKTSTNIVKMLTKRDEPIANVLDNAERIFFQYRKDVIKLDSFQLVRFFVPLMKA